MEYEVFKRVVDKLSDLGVLFVSLYGGEPTLHPQIGSFIRYAKSKGMGVYLNSDLTACPSDERLVEAAESGVDIISFSLDKLEPATDNKRAVSSIDGRLNLLRKLQRRHGFGLHCNVTLHRGNLPEAQQVVQYLLDHRNIGISIRPALFPIPYPQTEVRSRLLLLTPENIPAIEELTEWILAKKRQGAPIAVPDSYLKNFPLFLAGGYTWDCGAQRDILFVEWDGSLLTCSYFIKQAPPSPYVQLAMSYEGLESDHWKRVSPLVHSTLEHCNVHCYTSAYYCTSYYRRHRLEALRMYLMI